MSVEPKGERSTLVFIHGGGVEPWMWEEQIDYFSGEYDVATPTLPGHDIHRRSVFSTHRQAAEAVACHVGLLDQPRPVTVVGFSLGGQTAIQLAASYPHQVDRLVVVSSLLRPWRGAGALGLLAAGSTPLSRNRRFAKAQAAQLSIPPAMFEEYHALSRLMTAKTLRNLITANFSFSVPPEILVASRPVLLMAGDREDTGFCAAWSTSIITSGTALSGFTMAPGMACPLPSPGCSTSPCSSGSGGRGGSDHAPVAADPDVKR